jgi:hypothetical protein
VTERKVNVFFYGLFMDMGLLQQRGLAPSQPQVAWLDGYDIAIHERATLLVNAAERVYGIVTGLTHAEIDMLYAEPSVLEYRPEAVLVTLEDAHQVPALCYNLPQVSGTHRNTAYADRLLEVARRLAFPAAYLDKLQRLTQASV